MLAAVVRGCMHDRGTLDDHTDTILEQVHELVGSHLISLLWVKFEGLQLASATSELASRRKLQVLSPTVEAARDIGTDLPDPERNIATG